MSFLVEGTASPVSRKVRKSPFGAVAIDKEMGHIVALSDSSLGRGTGFVQVRDVRDGALRRTVTTGIQPQLLVVTVVERSRRIFVTNRGAPKTAASAASMGSVSVLDADSGGVIRTVMVGANPAAIVVSEKARHVFVLNRDSHSVSMLDALSGSVLRTVTVGQTPCAAVVDEKTQRVFVANAGSGSVSMIDATTGKVLHTVHVGLNPDGIAIDAHIGHVFVTQMGAVSMLDATSGLVLKTIQTMRAPLTVSVDERAGRVFVAGSDDGTLAVLRQLVLRHPIN